MFFGQNIHRLLPKFGLILADAGYTLMFHVMTPYAEDEGFGPLEANYNYLHLASRMVVECALGLLKNRFQIFLKPLNMSSRDYFGRNITAATANGLIVDACMRLHNALINLNNDVEPIPDINEMENREDANENTNAGGEVVLGEQARARRDRIRDWLALRMNIEG